jgi:hypothetical protein
MPHGAKLSRKQEQAIAALLTEPTIAAAAAQVGVASCTLLRWMERRPFRAAYLAARRQVVDQALAILQSANVSAVETLLRNLTAATATPADQIRAAKVVLDHSLRGVELADFGARLEAVEAAIRERKRP